MHGQSSDSTAFARHLRTDAATDAERTLWRCLRGTQLGVKFRRQHPFSGFVLDFVSFEAKLVIELDGGQHMERTDYDDARSKVLQEAGFQVIRFWNHEVFQEPEAVLERIRLVIEDRRAMPNRRD
ncbi:hypothetical protein dqs_3201 [Azoarcus olearius]|uniref:endonuclease domain-containing protein n=1 Tax=Azoarcus sp. (strain BH72) TaxID=418699 RepID=UPI0008062DEA|nr:DUF559 domain-containing protein [Azoarcus olearius]ANQ86229.1 hypothetical protein dqs_3201 [Azoarcus olearius]